MKYAHLVLVFILFPGQAAWAAAEEASSSLSGHWRVTETAENERQRLQAIDEATQGMRAMQQRRARSRLLERTSPPRNLILEVEESKVTIGSGDRRVELELGGSSMEVSGDEGKAQLSAEMEGQRLIVVARSRRGERTSVYRMDGDHLLVEVTMTNGQLAGPLKYASTYALVE